MHVLQVWNGSCVAIKSHEGTLGFPDPDPKLYDKAIIVIRRPHDSILAEFKRRHWDVNDNITVLGTEIFKGRTSVLHHILVGEETIIKPLIVFHATT